MKTGKYMGIGMWEVTDSKTGESNLQVCPEIDDVDMIGSSLGLLIDLSVGIMALFIGIVVVGVLL